MECRQLDGQICDLGRCECGPGYEHYQQSGICQRSNAVRHAKQRGSVIIIYAEQLQVHKNVLFIVD